MEVAIKQTIWNNSELEVGGMNLEAANDHQPFITNCYA